MQNKKLTMLVMAILAIGTFVVMYFFVIHKRVEIIPEQVAIAPQVPVAQPVPAEVHTVSGTVEKISGQEITLKDFIEISKTSDVSVSQLAQIAVTVDQSTIIERLVHKDLMAFSKELDAFGERQTQEAQNSTTPSAPPEPFTREKIALEDIKLGDIMVTSFILGATTSTTFTATKIDIQN